MFAGMRRVWLHLAVAIALACAATMTMSARQGSYWGQDNCFYSWNGRGYSTTVCRVVRSAFVTDYLNPQTRQWTFRFDNNPANRVSLPPHGIVTFTETTVLSGQAAGWVIRNYAPVPGSSIPLGLVSYRTPQGVWITNDPSQAQAQTRAQNQAAYTQSAHCQAQRQGRLIAPGVHENIPWDLKCHTPQERAYYEKMGGTIVSAGMGAAARQSCEMSRDSQPYGPDGRLRDGSIARNNGPLNSGWHWTAAGPMMNACP